MIKRILSLILIIGIFVTIGTPIAQARWTHLRSLSLGLSRSNNIVTSTTSISGLSGTTRISAIFTLERLENGRYQQVDSWSASSNSITLLNTRNTSNCPSGTYRLNVTVTITRNGTDETVSDSLVRVL